MANPTATIRKRHEDSGPVVARYVCYKCQTSWEARYRARWELLDPSFKRDTCPACHTGAAILAGYTPSLTMTAPAEQLELKL